MATTSLKVNELDFEEVKEALIDYLSQQAEFQDYEFTGSGLNTIIDLCASMIHHVGVHANFALRESFLESAQLRKNVVSIAKELGYFPRQAQAAEASFKLTLDKSADGGFSDTTVTIKKDTTFVSTLADGSTINFVTFGDNPLVDEGVAAGSSPTKVLSGTVYVVQGYYGQQSFTVQSGDQQYILQQSDIDVNYLSVTVKPLPTVTEVWSYAKDLTQVNPGSEVFYLNENNGLIELYFGNGTLGKAVEIGWEIICDYLVTRGRLGNNIRTFNVNTDIVTGEGTFSKNLFSTSSVTPASGGADREDEDSIRLLAPLSYQRQNRIVTIDDYKSAVLENYGNVEAINAWGGESSDPPEYGKVFVSVKPRLGETISPTTKLSIENDILAKFNVVGITPEIVDPEYMDVNLETTVYFNKDKTSLQASQISSLVAAEIEAYFSDSVFDYEQSFKYSKMVARIDLVNAAITNSTSKVSLTKSFRPAQKIYGTYVVKYFNPLKAGTLTSSTWINLGLTNSQLKDDGAGNIDLYKAGAVVRRKVGSVDYNTGVVSMTFNPEMNIAGTTIYLSVTPESTDIDVKFNNLATLGTNSVTTIAVTR